MDTWGEEIERELSLAIEVIDAAQHASDAVATGPAPEPHKEEEAAAPTVVEQAEGPATVETEGSVSNVAAEPSVPTAQLISLEPSVPTAQVVDPIPIKILHRSKAMCDMLNTDDSRHESTICIALKEKVNTHEQSLRRLRHEVTQCTDVVARFELILSQTVQRVENDLARIEATQIRNLSARGNEPRNYQAAGYTDRGGYRSERVFSTDAWAQKQNNHWKQHGGTPPPAPLSTGGAPMAADWEWKKSNEHPSAPSYDARQQKGQSYNPSYRDRPPSARGGKERRGAVVYPSNE